MVWLATLNTPAPGAFAATWCLFVGGSVLTLGALGASTRRRVLLLVIGLRMIALLTAPLLSDDLFRYVHEARASRLGLATPYAIAPADLSPPPPPDDGLSARVNHPEVPAAYPPTSQLLLAAVIGAGDLIGAPIGTWRAAMIALDLLVVLVLFRLPRRRQRWAFAWYGLHPIALLEACVGAHLDAVGMALIAGALLLATRPLWAGIAVGLASGIKPIAVLALVGLPLRSRALLIAAAGVLVGVLVPTAPYLAVSAPLLGGLSEYTARWEAAPTGYAVVERIVGAPLLSAAAAQRWTHLRRGDDGWQVDTAGVVRLSSGAPAPPWRSTLIDHHLVGRLAAAGLLAVVVGLLMRRRRRGLERATWAFAALWWLAPTVHPWYLLWLLPLAAVLRSRALWCWGAAMPLTYQAALQFQATGVWDEALWPRLVALAAFVGGAALDLRPWWRALRAQAAAGRRAGSTTTAR